MSFEGDTAGRGIHIQIFQQEKKGGKLRRPESLA
jgi:hypothetical protein